MRSTLLESSHFAAKSACSPFYLGSFCFGDFFGDYKELTCKQKLTLFGSRLSERLINNSTATMESN